MDAGRTRIAASIALLLGAAASAPAAVPAVDYFYPAGGQQGTTVTIAAGTEKGPLKPDKSPVKVWSDTPGLAFGPADDKGRFEVSIAADCPPGAHLVRLYNAEGASAPHVFVVGRHREQQEPESKDAPRGPHPVAALPAALNGRLEKRGEVDTWSMDLKAGKWLVADLQARRLGAPIDAALKLVDPDGAVVAFGHDVFGMDPLIAYQVPRSGRYVIEVAGFAHPPSADVRFAGSPATVYRLNVTAGPYARYAFPPVVWASGRQRIRLYGWNLGPDADSLAVDVSPEAGATAVWAGGAVDNDLQLPVVERAGVDEAEPNESTPQELSVPGAVHGRLQHPGDADRYAIKVKKGDRLSLSVAAKSLHSPVDPVLSVSDAKGEQLAREDDTGGVREDPRLQWQAPADGTYTVAISDLHQAGGPGAVYRLDIVSSDVPAAPVVETSSILLKPGGSADLSVKITATRPLPEGLELTVEGLPDGVTAKPVTVPSKGGSATISLKGDASATPGGYPIRVRSRQGDGEGIFAQFVTGLDDPLLGRTPHLWLTVSGSPKEPDGGKAKAD